MPVCTKCRKRRSVYSFAIKSGERRHSSCKICKNGYNRGWYKKNRKKHIQAVRRNSQRYYEELQAWVNTFKTKPCADCHVSYPPYVMQFDHLDGETKEESVSRMMCALRPRAEIEAEIDKCEVVCANCHAERTHRRKASVRELEAREAF